MVHRLTNIKRSFRAKVVMAKLEAITRTKNRRAELVKSYKEYKEWDAQPNNDDLGYESEYCSQPWKKYEDEKYITNK